MTIGNSIKKTFDKYIKEEEISFSTQHPVIKNALKNIETLSFEETHKTAYSHGLESIYALENVDVKTVRKLQSEAPTSSLKKIQKPVENYLEDPQLLLDLGEEWVESMESFILQEPIQVLGLAKHAEKCLLDMNKTTLGDLLQVDLREFIFVKGMGQGHIDDIEKKLNQYTLGKSLSKTNRIDYASWIKTLTADQDRKKMYVLLDFFKLSELITLAPTEYLEMRRLNLDKRHELANEAKILIRQDLKIHSVKQNMQRLINVFLKPWIRQRQGFATKSELDERLEMIAINPSIAMACINFLKDIYLCDEGIFSATLYPIGDALFCADLYVFEHYQLIIRLAKTYFYRNTTTYTLKELIILMSNECAPYWIDFPEEFLTKALRMSPEFRVRKGPTHELMIRLA